MGSLLRRGIVVLALAVLGVAGACGGDSEPPGGDGPSADAPSGDDGPGAVDGAAGDTSPSDARDLCTRDQECDDRNGCTVDTCPMGRCVYTVRPDGESCNDDVACTDPDTCAGGVCSGPPRDCAALDDFCNLGVCQEAAGGCVAMPRADGAGCDDGRFCTDPDTCTSGACGGPVRDCAAAGDACNAGVCDEAASACARTPRADGTGCEDGVFCTAGDTCQAGVCASGAPPACADGDACTADACDALADACRNDPVPPISGAEGPQGDPTCGNGVDDDCDGFIDLTDRDCVDCFVAADCDDGNACTADACNAGVCASTALTGPACEDGLYCTVGDACAAGACVAGGPRSCADADACTLDSCDEAGNVCTYAARAADPTSPVSSSVDDGTPLTVCLVAGSGARVVVWTDLVDLGGVPLSGAAVTIGGGAATEAATRPGTYYREITAAGAPMVQMVGVVATACGTTTTLSRTVVIDHVAGNATAGGTGGCSPADGNLRVRVVASPGGAPVAGASVLVGAAQGTPFERAPAALFGGASSAGSNVATTDGAGYASFYDHGAALSGPITVTAGAPGRAYVTLVAAEASDVVLPLPELRPAPVPTTTYDMGTGMASVSNCNDLDVGLVLPKLDVGFFSDLDMGRFFARNTCWTSGNGNVGNVAVPENMWIPTQSIGTFCLGGSVAQERWTARLKNTAATGVTENVAMSHVRIPISDLMTVLSGGGSYVDLLPTTTYRGLGWILDETVPTPPTGGRSINANEDFPNTFTVTYSGRPTETDVVGFTLADYAGTSGQGPLFLLGHAVHRWDDAGSSVAVRNSDLNAAGAPAGVRRLGSVSALYLDAADHPGIAASRVSGVSTVLLRGGASPPFGAAGGTGSVTDFLDVVGPTFAAPAQFRWENATRNGNQPMYSRHELLIQIDSYLPVLSCATENDVRESWATGWIVLKPFGLECGAEECFTLPTLPASFPRAAAAVQKKSGFEAYAGSGAACAGPGGCVAGETCVDPDGAAGSAGSMCMAGSGTAADPWRTERYLWRLHVYDLGLLAAWDFDRFDLATHAAGLTHESANRAGFQ